jgi:hypothetical protein
MAKYFQYSAGAVGITTLAMVTPIWLVCDDKHLEAAVIGIPTLLVLVWGIAATIVVLRKD